jgi:hypothetical protein
LYAKQKNFSVDESWLFAKTSRYGAEQWNLNLLRKLPAQEKEIIEAVLSESGGGVYGPSGVAAQLAIPTIHSGAQNQVAEDQQEALQNCRFPPGIAHQGVGC